MRRRIDHASGAAKAMMTTPWTTRIMSSGTPAIICIMRAPVLKRAEKHRGQDGAQRVAAADEGHGDAVKAEVAQIGQVAVQRVRGRSPDNLRRARDARGKARQQKRDVDAPRPDWRPRSATRRD